MTADEGALNGIDAVGLASRVLEIGLLAQRSGDLDSVLQSIVERLLMDTGASLVAIGLVSEVTREVVHGASAGRAGRPTPLGYRQPIDRGIMGRTVRTGQVVRLDDITERDEFLHLVDGMRSAVAVPLTLAGAVIGALSVESDQRARFGPQEVALLQAIATPIAQAIEIGRLSQEERQHMSKMVVLNRISRVITSTTDLDELLDRTVEAIREQLGYFIVAIGLWDDQQSYAELRAASCSEPIDLPIGHRQGIGEGIVGEAAQSGESLLVPDVNKHHNYVPTHPAVRCEMVCPLRVGDEVLGFLDVEGTTPAGFGEDDLLLAETLADHISQAVANARHLRRISELREDLANMLAHDLRNPLSVIQSTLQLLEMDADLPATPGSEVPSLDYVDDARYACKQALGLIEDFLDVQRMEAEGLPIEALEIEVPPLVKDFSRQLRPVAEAEQVQLLTVCEPDLPTCFMDHGLILRVLQNLGGNALNHTPAGGQVTIRVSHATEELLGLRLARCPEALLFEVIDTGRGIAMEHRRRIFDKFATVQVRREAGTISRGLGLAFCRIAVRAHGGVIWVDCPAGGGSAFCFLLPLVPLSSPPPSIRQP